MAYRFFEDFVAGETIELGSVVFTQAEIIDFARAYDPQPMHTDPEAARGSIYGGLIASGWQTATSYMRMLVDHIMRDSHSIGSPGIANFRWLKPVPPGATPPCPFPGLDPKPTQSPSPWGHIPP